MKKLVCLIAVVMMFVGSASVKAGAGDTLLLYIPNRLVDMVDMFSLTLGFGPAIGVEGHCTKYLSIGGEIGATAQVVKGVNRQYGFCRSNGWDVSFLMIGAESREVDEPIGSVKKYFFRATGVPSMTKNPYDFHNGAKDFWSVGAKLAALIEMQFEIHPVEIADFILGWVFIDIKGDDFTPDDINE
ncbi:MAG: hypothetical protein GXP32_08025 [Kiritimatiellaeota bacterium]|nr:hypothetical protein [Kiritimatiellota bacterium]